MAEEQPAQYVEKTIDDMMVELDKLRTLYTTHEKSPELEKAIRYAVGFIIIKIDDRMEALRQEVYTWPEHDGKKQWAKECTAEYIAEREVNIVKCQAELDRNGCTTWPSMPYDKYYENAYWLTYF